MHGDNLHTNERRRDPREEALVLHRQLAAAFGAGRDHKRCVVDVSGDNARGVVHVEHARAAGDGDRHGYGAHIRQQEASRGNLHR